MATLERSHDEKQKLLKHAGRMFINNKWVDAVSGRTFDVFDPATGEVLTKVAEGDKADVDIAVAAARAAFDGGAWSRVSPAERGRLLWKVADLLERDAEAFARLETIDNGKPLSMSRGDVGLAIDMFRYMGGWATKIVGETMELSVGFPHHSYTSREPVGVAAQIVPWNFPLLMAAWKIAPALAAGCSVVLKSAEQTPLTALKLAEIFEEVGFPAGAVNFLSGFGETAGAALAAHPYVDKVAFTGSTEVGKLIAKAATGNLKRLTLELGGKSPVIIFPDADLDAAAQGAAAGIFYNQGQVCCAGSRVYVHESAFDRVVADISDRADAIKVRPGLDEDSEMGPLVSDEQLSRVMGFFDSGREDGARVVTGGGRHGDKGYFVKPTVYADTNRDMRLVREEIFGPVIVAEPFGDDDLDRIAAIANDTEYGLASSVWSRDISKALMMTKKIKAGTVWVNCHNVFDSNLPFGGFKQSGWGREMGHYAIENYTEVKSVTIKL
ncbi:betaine-aldehyde dehydrogenase [Tardibacter chloracetimidivorans]|uniref:Betaine-aldehyde dehydrogenase n=1 Tax=Tardibacter chloracetimidivorans TaxID=1921510 RepID=A0A1L3ZSK8_9SPHN|nr:aldehyde dehydrogenase family protein [Tardibacter chloracetimidivorans]API58623.1 betaine-aldehyde dehydrogenase [Tardibacter chloracetimidivorans]